MQLSDVLTDLNEVDAWCYNDCRHNFTGLSIIEFVQGDEKESINEENNNCFQLIGGVRRGLMQKLAEDLKDDI